MIKVITYGTYDLLHYGHIRLLERAKALGDYLIVGVTSEDYDKKRGKINNHQSLMERIASVRALGIADEIIVEEYEGQKIDDIRRYEADIFTVGSDWTGKFDYLNEYCQVIYLPRTEGVSSTEIRSDRRKIRIGLVGEALILKKFRHESEHVNGCEVVAIFSNDKDLIQNEFDDLVKAEKYEDLLGEVDAVYIASHPSRHYNQVKKALLEKKHVLCEAPIVMKLRECQELFALAKENNCVLMDAVKTAYSTAYARLLLMLKGEKIGKIVSVDATCTSLRNIEKDNEKFLSETWNSLCAWGPTAMLPVFQMLGTDFEHKQIVSAYADEHKTFDLFTKIDFVYKNATASIKVGKGVKSEGELVISGTEAYVYVPAPWWKTDYYEVRYENITENRKFFYQLDGEGIRYEIVAFLKNIESGRSDTYISRKISQKICSVIEDFNKKTDVVEIVI